MSRIERDQLDRAVAEAQGEPIDPAVIEGAATRVWQKLCEESAIEMQSALTPAATAATPGTGSLAGCPDFQALIPAFIAGQLPPARHALVEDHTRHCIPCRRALREARDGKQEAKVSAAPVPSRAGRTAFLALAAALVLALGGGLFFALQDFFVGGSMAQVASIEGSLFRVDGDGLVPLRAGDSIPEGDVVRTARDSHAVLTMKDGSKIEMSDRAGLALDAALSGNTVELERGQVIIQAAQQRKRHLYVATDDCKVAVTGTIFSVNHGTKGSRVSVVEGEVHVKHAGNENVLHAGGQVTTHTSVAAVPVAREIAWSQDAPRLQQLLAELTALGREIDGQVERPGMRFSTQLLDLAPQGTTIYIGLPNLSTTLAETHRILEQRVAENPILKDWWSSNLGSSENEARFSDMIERIGALGRNLGEEIAVAVGTEKAPVLYAKVTGAALRATLEQEIAAINQKAGKEVVRIITDPANPGAASHDALLVWIGNDLLVASPEASRIAAVAANAANAAAGTANPFAGTAFRQKIAQVYADGTGFLLAADLQNLIRSGHKSETDKTAESLGIHDVEHFIVNRREEGGRTETRAALTFDRPRRGVASWLDAPGPMGSLSFFSADANLVGAFVVREPVTLVDELLTLSPEFAGKLAEFRQETGIDLRNDLAAPLGGEVAFGLDGPIAPKPSFKVVIEVYNPTQLQQTIERAVARINQEIENHGKPGLALRQETAGGRTWYSLVAQSGPEVFYTYADGYLIAAPSRALIERGLSQRAAGTTLASSPKFRDLLGQDGEVNVSALVYQNLASTLESVAKVLPQGEGKSGQPNLRNLLLGHGPGLIYAYGERDRILFAGSGERGVMGFNLETLAGLGGVAGMMDSLHGEARRQAAQMEVAK